MKANSYARALSVTSMVMTGLLVLAAQTAAGATPVGQSPKVVSKAHQPAGTPRKASSFAPHPTNRRVFGQPIQPPILGHVAPKKPPSK
jgi:hypothetical protein